MFVDSFFFVVLRTWAVKIPGPNIHEQKLPTVLLRILVGMNNLVPTVTKNILT